jgi:hypothetical protein
VPFGIESSSARIASAKASTVRLSAQSGMVALENRVDERAVDGAALRRQELRQLLAPLVQRRRAFAGPDERVQREALHALGVALGEERRTEARPTRCRRS